MKTYKNISCPFCEEELYVTKPYGAYIKAKCVDDTCAYGPIPLRFGSVQQLKTYLRSVREGEGAQTRTQGDKMTVKRYAVRPDGTPYESPQGRIYICDQCGEQGWDSPEHSEDCPEEDK
jgi:hypothetical protein